jgi:hypothetical protein
MLRAWPPSLVVQRWSGAPWSGLGICLGPIGSITFWPTTAQLCSGSACAGVSPGSGHFTIPSRPPPDAAYPATREPRLQIRTASDACAVSHLRTNEKKKRRGDLLVNHVLLLHAPYSRSQPSHLSMPKLRQRRQIHADSEYDCAAAREPP